MTDPTNAPIAALTALRDAGLVTDRDRLNSAWVELEHGLPAMTPAPTAVCQRILCSAPGVPFVEPAGTWCRDHVPQLWRWPTGSPWACARCWQCGSPGGWPNRGNELSRPVCRAHVPRWMRRYLTTTTTNETGMPR